MLVDIFVFNVTINVYLVSIAQINVLYVLRRGSSNYPVVCVKLDIMIMVFHSYA